ncbi:MAG: ABC transporter ATP-binding protein [Pirellulales bacterium]|nr:ABC transporter ATP-binding protein [Pirellulales bacterium]
MSLAAFHRARRSSPAVRGPSLLTGALSIASSLFLVALLLVMGLAAELLVTRGDLVVAESDRASVEELAGPPTAQFDGELRYENRGLLPVVWRLHGTPRGAVVRSAYASLPALQANHSALFALALMGLAIAAIRSLTQYLRELAVEHAAQSVVTELRRAIYRQALQLESIATPRSRVSDAVELFGPVAETVRRGLVAWWRALPGAVVSIVLLLALALYMEPWATLAALLVGGLWWLAFRGMRQRMRHRERLMVDRAEQNMAVLADNLRQVRMARGLMLDALPGETFDKLLDRYRAAATDRDNTTAGIEPLGQLVMAAIAALMLFLSGINLLREPPRVSVAELTILFTAILALYPRARQLIDLRRQLEPVDEAAREILAYLDREPGLGQVVGAKQVARWKDSIALERVCFCAPDGVKILDDVTLKIPAGGRVAIVSSDRRVPLAIAGLLARLDEPTSGRVLFDGQDIRAGTLESVRGQVAHVLQQRLLFNASVAENVCCETNGRVDTARVNQAAKLARAYDFVQRLPHGFDTVVGEHGTRLEASEVLRIGLARALLRNPSLLVLEEPEGAIDEQGGAEFDAALERIARQTTLVLLPTRLSTLRSVDCVYLLHAGKLKAQGKHAELLQSSELYRHLQYLRFNEFRGQVGS